jgi:hypothetical protein
MHMTKNRERDPYRGPSVGDCPRDSCGQPKRPQVARCSSAGGLPTRLRSIARRVGSGWRLPSAGSQTTMIHFDQLSDYCQPE